MHLDDTVGFDYTRGKLQFLAEEVNALYVQVPPAIKEGNLKIWGLHRSLLASLKIFMWRHVGAAKPDALTRPQQNTMITFRGDALHAVQAFTLWPNSKIMIDGGGGDINDHNDDEEAARFKTKR
ncbi:unnamed protein product, partial [Heterosigma akashiwo]